MNWYWEETKKTLDYNYPEGCEANWLICLEINFEDPHCES